MEIWLTTEESLATDEVARVKHYGPIDKNNPHFLALLVLINKMDEAQHEV